LYFRFALCKNKRTMVNNALVCMANSLFSLSLKSKNKYGTVLISTSLGIQLSGLVSSHRQEKMYMKTPGEVAHNKVSLFFLHKHSKQFNRATILTIRRYFWSHQCTNLNNITGGTCGRNTDSFFQVVSLKIK
jgi:hypothetical protein